MRRYKLKPNSPLKRFNSSPEIIRLVVMLYVDRARDLDPVSTSIVSDRGMISYVAGHRAEGLASLRTLAQEQPTEVSPHRALAEIALYEGRPEEFLRESATTARLRSDVVGLADAKRWRSKGLGEQGIEEAMLREARQKRDDWFRTAQLASLAGNRDEASHALARACDAHEPTIVSASSDLWLSRTLTHEDIAKRCGRMLPLS